MGAHNCVRITMERSDASVMLAGARGHAQWTFHGTATDGTAVVYRGVGVFEFIGDRIRPKDAFRKKRSKPIGG